MCEYYIYDDEYDSYYCDMELDEDEMYDLLPEIQATAIISDIEMNTDM